MPSDARILHDAAHDLPRAPGGADPLVERLASASTVLIGEATHGTHEFYDLRAQLTRRLIEDHGFHAVAIEGDWPDAWEVHRHVTGSGPDAADAGAALSGFTRFPRWMWRNDVTHDFVTWLRERNAAVPAGEVPAAFVGLDLYSMHRSMAAVLEFLDRTDPEAAARARARYACFDHTSVDARAYGWAVTHGRQESCEPAVLDQLGELLEDTSDGRVSEDELFDVARNAKLVVSAEEYHRTMFRGGSHSWNLRDQHMEATLEALRAHLAQQVEEPRIVVWAHNSHVGDARATELARRGEVTLGQLVRERHPASTLLVGMTTYRGEVTAAHEWDGPHQRMRVLDGLPGSYEEALHDTGRGRVWLDLHEPGVREVLEAPRLQRAIGVIYRPETERISHYLSARLPDEFDVLCHVDQTTALTPLDARSSWDDVAVPDTYPWAV